MNEGDVGIDGPPRGRLSTASKQTLVEADSGEQAVLQERGGSLPINPLSPLISGIYRTAPSRNLLICRRFLEFEYLPTNQVVGSSNLSGRAKPCFSMS